MAIDAAYLHSLVGELQARNVTFEPGLSDEEISRVESTYDFRFPSDLRSLLQFALPISEGFPDWRRGWIAKPIVEWQRGASSVRGHNLVPIQEQLDLPADGICFDIERNNFWMDQWGANHKIWMPRLRGHGKRLRKLRNWFPSTLIGFFLASHTIPAIRFYPCNRRTLSTTDSIWLLTSRTNSRSVPPHGLLRRRGKSRSGALSYSERHAPTSSARNPRSSGSRCRSALSRATGGLRRPSTSKRYRDESTACRRRIP
jgi:hypothetical protein